METKISIHKDPETRILTVGRQDTSVLCSKAVAGNAAVRVEGHPHSAAVSVDRWRGDVATEPEAERVI